MNLLSRLDLLEPYSFLCKEPSYSVSSTHPLLDSFLDDFLVFEEQRRLGFGRPITTSFDLDLRYSLPFSPICNEAVDLLRIERYVATPAAIRVTDADAHLRSLADRVAALELGFVKAAAEKRCPKYTWEAERDRKYKWEAETKDAKGAGRKWRYVAEAKADGEKKLKWEVDVSDGAGKGTRAYAFEAASVVAKKKKKGEKKKGEKKVTKLVEITESEPEPGAVVLRKAFGKRFSKGKGKELSPQDAALIIQMNFRAHILRRSQALRDLRSLAIAKAKLKEIRALFSNFSYRRRVANVAEERQKFSEKIIVLLLTVDEIEGADCMVRASKRSMVEELEAMLDVVDPLPAGRLNSLKRRKFDLPEFSAFQREMVAGVAKVVELVNEDEECSSA